MALIRVDHSVLINVADNIKSYCEEQNKEMRSADSAVKTMLLKDWLGSDADEFNAKWEQVDEDGSVAVQFRNSLESFENALRGCAKEYKTAQEDSYNEASHLPG